MSKFLDSNGLLYLWGKVAAKIGTRVSKAGDTMTGPLVLADDPASDMQATTKRYVDDKVSGAGTGDMLKSVYDTNGNGIVDNAEKVNGHTVASDVPTGAKFTDTTYGLATPSISGLMSASDYSKLSAFGAAETYALKSDISNAYRYKGSKASFAVLPSTGNAVGDVWNAEDTGMNYAWTGTAWDALGEVFSVDVITNAEIDAITV